MNSENPRRRWEDPDHEGPTFDLLVEALQRVAPQILRQYTGSKTRKASQHQLIHRAGGHSEDLGLHHHRPMGAVQGGAA